MLKFTALFMSIIIFFCSLFGINVTQKITLPSPNGLSQYTEKERVLVTDADFYVATDGNDSNAGDFLHPFATIEKAKDAVKSCNKSNRNGITVAIKAGDYRVSSLNFTYDDSGTSECPVTYCAYGDGEVVINGGVSISPKDFVKVTDENVLRRFTKKAQKKIVCYDLKNIEVTAEDYGKIYAIGSYNTAAKYTGDTTGPLYSELFVNDTRMTVARYPNEGYLKTGEVVSEGEQREDSNHQLHDYWNTIVNPRSDVYKVSSSLAKRINSWQTLDDVWMFGFWKYDWADASSPIGEFDYTNKTISPKYVSMFGAKQDAPYYFFNILEELDTENEWYLDRENGIIYLYPSDDFENATVDLSLTTKNIVDGKVDYITFDGLTFKGTRSDAINLLGRSITIKNCLVKNVAGNAIVLGGQDNLVSECEITHTGKGGIYLSGGDTAKLISGNNRADNNLIHDWSDIYQTYQPAVTLSGVGNYCTHNEIYNSPHEAITFSGNNHTIEYNVIHDVCLLTSDAGAIYAGRHWDWYGNKINYNCVYNLGSNGFTPDGIYLDDALSGQMVYGNLIINVPKNGILAGGGRDNDIRNNVIINTGDYGIQYDQRAIDCIYEGWFHDYSGENGGMWQNLFNSPWQSEIWQEAFPQMKDFITDFSRTDEAGFVANPANNIVTDNILVNAEGSFGKVGEKVIKYSTFENNAVFKLTKQNKIFTDCKNGDYSLCENSKALEKVKNFEPLPISKMGRY